MTWHPVIVDGRRCRQWTKSPFQRVHGRLLVPFLPRKFPRSNETQHFQIWGTLLPHPRVFHCHDGPPWPPWYSLIADNHSCPALIPQLTTLIVSLSVGFPHRFSVTNRISMFFKEDNGIRWVAAKCWDPCLSFPVRHVLIFYGTEKVARLGLCSHSICVLCSGDVGLDIHCECLWFFAIHRRRAVYGRSTASLVLCTQQCSLTHASECFPALCV